jgi:uncharacterized protein (DUF1697 family)
MPRRYAAFLRGINLGGRRASGAKLAAAFDATEGISGAAPFIASGNVVFDEATRRRPPAIAAAVEASIRESFGWDSKVFLRDAGEIATLAAVEPFTQPQLAASAGKPQIVLFEHEISKQDANQVLEMTPDGDVMIAEGRELHWLPSAGLSDSDLDMKAIDRLLGTGTTRTANTIRRLHTKYFG